MIRKIKRNNSGLMKAGQDLIVAGYAGLAGTSRIVKDMKPALIQWFTKDYLRQFEGLSLGDMNQENWEYWKIRGASEWEPAGDGGILTAVWNLLGAYGLGAEFSLRLIPVKQGTIEICERFGLNPYRLYSEGCYVLASENGGRLVKQLEIQNMKAAVIGITTKDIAKVMTDNGERSFLNRPEPDEWEKLRR